MRLVQLLDLTSAFRMLFHRAMNDFGEGTGSFQMDLLSLLSLTYRLKSSDPRDMLYALLGVDEVKDISIIPDYTKSTAAVFKEFATNYIQTRHDLSILCMGGIGTICAGDVLDLPSWAPNFGRAPTINGRYNACGSYSAIYTIPPGSWELISQGIICDWVVNVLPGKEPVTISPTIEFESVFDILETWKLALSLVSNPHPTGIPQHQAFFRNLIQDDCSVGYGRPQFHDEDSCETFLHLLCGFLFTVVVKNSTAFIDDIEHKDKDKWERWLAIHKHNSAWAKGLSLWRGNLLESDVSEIPESDEDILLTFFGNSESKYHLEWLRRLTMYDSEIHPAHAFLEKAFESQLNKSFFVSTKEYMGVGPRAIQVGDKICVLLGCTQPLIIRRIEDHYLIVGPCYIYGMMSGEMMNEMEAGNLKVDTFCFR